MPINTKYLASFEADCFYHVTARAVGKELLFYSDANKQYFLQQYLRYLSGYVDTYSYILMNNHVHWLIRCTTKDALLKHLTAIPEQERKKHQQKFISGKIGFEETLEFRWKDFFISYARAFNKMYQRNGALFINPFRRIEIADDAHFTQLIIYQHANVLKHLGQKNFQEYRWSSYQAVISDQPTNIKRAEVLDWFGGRERFITTHRENAAYYYEHPYSME